MESVDLGRTVAEPDAMAAVPEPVARRFLAVGLTLARDEGGAPWRLTVAMADPFDVIVLDHLRSLFGGGAEIVPLLAGRSDVERFLERAYRHDLSVAGILREIETGEAGLGGLPANADEYSQPIIRLVDVLLSDAVKRGASDIHFEPEAGFLRVRYRVLGFRPHAVLLDGRRVGVLAALVVGHAAALGGNDETAPRLCRGRAQHRSREGRAALQHPVPPSFCVRTSSLTRSMA